MPRVNKLWAESYGFAEEDAGRIDHDAQGILRLEHSDVFVVKNLRHVVSRGVVETEVIEPEGDFARNGRAQVEQGERTTTGR